MLELHGARNPQARNHEKSWKITRFTIFLVPEKVGILVVLFKFSWKFQSKSRKLDQTEHLHRWDVLMCVFVVWKTRLFAVVWIRTIPCRAAPIVAVLCWDIAGVRDTRTVVENTIVTLALSKGNVRTVDWGLLLFFFLFRPLIAPCCPLVDGICA